MSFEPFDKNDFQQTGRLQFRNSVPEPLASKITELRHGLSSFPEYQLDFFRRRIVRRPTMRGSDGQVFGPPRTADGHWYFFIVGGDQDQVQLNVGMVEEYVRVGLGFQIGRQVAPKMPAFYVLQSFLGMRPPLPFRDALYVSVQRNGFRIEGMPTRDADETLHRLETFVITPDEEPVFVFLGALWDVKNATSKTLSDYRSVFLELLPFYEELLLAGGRYTFFPPEQA